MKDSTIIAVIVALMVILISIVLFTFALDSPQQDILNYGDPPGAMGGGGQVVTYSYPSNSTGFGQGEGDPDTNQNTTYVECNGEVCNVTKIPWVTPTFALQYMAGGGGAGTIGYVWVNDSSYTVAVGGGGGAAGSYQGGTK
jgi:hypothetical protein